MSLRGIGVALLLLTMAAMGFPCILAARYMWRKGKYVFSLSWLLVTFMFTYPMVLSLWCLATGQRLLEPR